MSTTIKLRRGPKSGLPTYNSTLLGEPYFTTDTGELYINRGTEVVKIGPAPDPVTISAVDEKDWSSTDQTGRITVQVRRGPSTSTPSGSSILAGELVWKTDTNELLVGDGAELHSPLPTLISGGTFL